MDVLRESEKLPHFEQRIVMKVTRLAAESPFIQNDTTLPKKTGVLETDFAAPEAPLKQNQEKNDNFFL